MSTVTLEKNELDQWLFYVKKRNEAKEVVDNANLVMQQAQETWRVASGGLESFALFLAGKYGLSGQITIDSNTGEVTSSEDRELSRVNGKST